MSQTALGIEVKDLTRQERRTALTDMDASQIMQTELAMEPGWTPARIRNAEMGRFVKQIAAG